MNRYLVTLSIVIEVEAADPEAAAQYAKDRIWLSDFALDSIDEKEHQP